MTRIWAGGAERVPPPSGGQWGLAPPPRAAPARHWACPGRFYIKRRRLDWALCRRRRVPIPKSRVPLVRAARRTPPSRYARQVPRLLPAPRGEPGRGLRGRGRGDGDLDRPRPPAGPATLTSPPSQTRAHTRGDLAPRPPPLEGLRAGTPRAALLGATWDVCARGAGPVRSWRRQSLGFLGVGVGQRATSWPGPERGTWRPPLCLPSLRGWRCGRDGTALTPSSVSLPQSLPTVSQPLHL